jgi:quercetin dioxygenase-like cupin family protein
MAHVGQTLENPITRERLTFLETADETKGELLRIELVFAPGGFVPAIHSHPQQEERIEVVSGTPSFWIAGDRHTAQAGEIVVVPPGTPHTWRNDGNGESRAVVELRPALRMEAVFESLAALAAQGKLDRRGFPSPLQGAVIAREFKDELAPARDPDIPFGWLPLPVLRLLLRVLAPVGAALGYRGNCSIDTQ